MLVNRISFEFPKKPFEKVDSFHTGRVRDHAPTGKHILILTIFFSEYDFSNGFLAVVKDMRWAPGLVYSLFYGRGNKVRDGWFGKCRTG